MKILLIDDHAMVRDALARMLRWLGHTVLPAPSGQAGLARLETSDGVDLVLTDFQMPGMNVGPQRPLLHRRRILGDAELQQSRRVPHFDRLDERAGRKFAVTHRPRAGSLDAGPHRVSDAGLEQPLVGRRDVRKGDDVPPDRLRSAGSAMCETIPAAQLG